MSVNFLSLFTIIQVKSSCAMEMVWLVWELVIYADLINSIHAWSKNGPQDRNAAGGSLGGWGLSRRSSLHGEHAGGRASGSGLQLKPQEFSGVSTMICPVSGADPCLQHNHRWGLSCTSGCDFNLRRGSTPDTGCTS